MYRIFFLEYLHIRNNFFLINSIRRFNRKHFIIYKLK